MLNETKLYIGWALSVMTPLLLFGAWLYVPWPGTLIAAIAAIGLFIGYMIYEYAAVKGRISHETVFEQVALAILILVIFSF
ncbi:MAG: hypothetical protein WDZ42_02685, partial [Candidatus Saccharimonadales bacterium]